MGIHEQTVYQFYQKRGLKKGKPVLSKKLANAFEKRTGISAKVWLSKDGKVRNFSKADRSLSEISQGTLVDHQIKRALNNGVEIKGIQLDNIKGASIDLTIGHFCDKHFLKEKGKVKEKVLERGESVNIEIKEKVSFSHRYFARVGTKTSFAKKGILVLVGHQIDPGYEGYLQVSAINLSHSPVKLWKSESIISLEIVKLQAQPHQRSSDSLFDLKKALRKELRKRFVKSSSDNILIWEQTGLQVENARSRKKVKMGLLVKALDQISKESKSYESTCRALLQIFDEITVMNSEFSALLKLFPGANSFTPRAHNSIYSQCSHYPNHYGPTSRYAWAYLGQTSGPVTIW